jgi:hypothetical protein
MHLRLPVAVLLALSLCPDPASAQRNKGPVPASTPPGLKPPSHALEQSRRKWLCPRSRNGICLDHQSARVDRSWR